MRTAALLALASLVGVTLTAAAPPAAAVDVAAALCGNDPACLDELPVTNDATLQAQFDAEPPPTLVAAPAAPVLGAPPLDDLTATTETTAAAYPDGYVARTEVTTSRYPATTAVHLAVYFGGASSPTSFCSGALIGPRFVGTAGHCVFQRSAGWVTRVDVIPGQVNSTTGGEMGGTKPFGTCRADAVFTVRGWKNDEKRSYDYGGVRIGSCGTGDRNVGVRTGTAGFHSSSDEGISGLAVNLHGYPSGDPLYKPGGTMWKGSSGTIYDLQTHLFRYRVQAAGGDSGGPVWRHRSDCGPGFCLYGVHVGHYAPAGESLARRITTGMFRNWANWRTT